MLKKFALTGVAFSSYLLTSQKDPQCCGIVGIVSKRPITQEEAKSDPKRRITLESFLCDGVELLKNRGYDSAGIFTYGRKMGQGRLIKYADELDFSENCIDRVVDEVLTETGIATVGIAHTRWATCGAKVSRNAHPHFDQSHRIFLVHNGIISNHADIKNKYLNGYKFTSQTDTEVLCQFIGLQIREGKSMVESLNFFGSIAGKASQWGLVIVDREQPDKLYTFTQGSPLLIGFSPQQDQIFVVSQMIAFQSYVDYYLPTNDGEIFQLNANQIPKIKNHYKSRLIKMESPPEVLKKPPEPYKHFYSYQIRQQGQIKFKPDFGRIKETVHFGSYLSMIACGSSAYAAHTSEPFFKLLKCFSKLNITDPAELDPHDITQNQTVVVISQSGETKDLITIVDDLKKKQKVSTIGIINVEGSTLARKVDFPIYIKVGRQICVAATKSFFHQVLNLIQFSTQVAEQKKSADPTTIFQIREELLIVPTLLDQIMKENETNCQLLAKKLQNKDSIFLLGKREGFAIAREAALKIKELNYIHAQALGASEMKHGPIALIDSRQNHQKETIVFLFIYANETYPHMMNSLDQMHSRNAYVVIITDCLHLIEANFQTQLKKHHLWRQELDKTHQLELKEFKGEEDKLKKLKQKYLKELKDRKAPDQKYDFALTVPHLKYMSHLLSIVPIQIFVEKMANLKGINPDFPRNLAKSVTV